jgi:hypothetical protein
MCEAFECVLAFELVYVMGFVASETFRPLHSKDPDYNEPVGQEDSAKFRHLRTPQDRFIDRSHVSPRPTLIS